MTDPYEVLGVFRTATRGEIKSAYRRIAKQTHPDLHGDIPENVERFREATEAYAILSDPDQRARYDSTGSVDEEEVVANRAEILAMVAYVRSMAKQTKDSARSYALRGVAWLAGGLLISLLSYAAASSSSEGGSYVVMWGAMLFGAIQALRGFAAYGAISAKARAIENELWSIVLNADSGDGPHLLDE